jgi:4-amino-4-deoxy-L-arabinose transferase-like glycosyltransferase
MHLFQNWPTALPMHLSRRAEQLVVLLICTVHLVLTLSVSLGPIFEGPDEIEHYRYIRTVARTHSLPNPYAQPLGEFHQAPLYYVLAAPLAVLIDDADFTQIEQRLNPFYAHEIGVPGSDNKNKYLHSRNEIFPYSESGTARAVHLIRLLSVGMGLGTVVTSYAIFRLLWPDRTDRRLAALGFVAFMPQFVFMSSTINNDNLLNLLATLSLFLLLHQQKNGPTRRIALFLGVVLGAALLTKISAAFLVFPVGVATLMLRSLWRSAVLTLAVVVFAAGWWYMRNRLLYGDFTNFNAWFSTWPQDAIRGGALALDIGLTRIPGIYGSFWARFGSGAVVVGEPLYIFYDSLAVVAVIGLLVSLAQTIYRQLWRSWWPLIVQQIVIIGVFAGAWVAAVIYAASIAWNGSSGRYLLPAIAAWGILLALGLEVWLPRRLRLPAALTSVVITGVAAGVCLWGYYLPAYAVQPLSTTIEQPLALRYENTAELIGTNISTAKARPGDVVWLRLYWRALRQPRTDLYTYLHSLDSLIVRRDSVPGTGNFPATEWQPGTTWAETYVVVIPQNAETQMVDSLVAGLYDPATMRELAVTNANGETVPSVIGQLAINEPAAPLDPDYWFGDIIGLAAPQVTYRMAELEVCLRWAARAATAVDYHVFIHVFDDKGQLIIQSDAPPKGGRYPTYAWTPGEVIPECVMLNAPDFAPNSAQVVLGLYDFANGERLPVRDRAGQMLENSVVVITPNSDTANDR